MRKRFSFTYEVKKSDTGLVLNFQKGCCLKKDSIGIKRLPKRQINFKEAKASFDTDYPSFLDRFSERITSLILR
jgi:hypothetical protein